jgi:hypothetical protein
MYPNTNIGYIQFSMNSLEKALRHAQYKEYLAVFGTEGFKIPGRIIS